MARAQTSAPAGFASSGAASASSVTPAVGAAVAATAPTAPALPEAPIAVSQKRDGFTPPGGPMVNGQPYQQPTEADRLRLYQHELIGVEPFAIPLITAAYDFGRNIPDGWGKDFPGYLQRYGSTYGVGAIRVTTKLILSSAQHEDTKYYLCHGCTLKERMHNAAISEFTARRGADGHRAFSITPVVSGYTGAIAAREAWYPPGYGAGDGAVSGTIGIAVRTGIRAARELYDMKKNKD